MKLISNILIIVVREKGGLGEGILERGEREGLLYFLESRETGSGATFPGSESGDSIWDLVGSVMEVGVVGVSWALKLCELRVGVGSWEWVWESSSTEGPVSSSPGWE